MSETLRDLVVSLSLNSDNFTRNIKSINKQIQEAESAFRLASAGLENFETTTAGLSSKLSALQRTFQLQQDAVGQYERALQQASDKLQECYTRQNDYAQRLTDAKDKQQQLKTEVASAAQAYKHYKNALGETDSATIAAKENLDAYKGEYRAAVQEVKKLEGQNVALKKSTQNAADAFSTAQTKLNGAKGAVKETAAEIDQCSRQLALSCTSWASAGEAIQASQRSITSIGKQLKTAESSYRLAAAGVKDFDKSAAGLTAKLALLQEKLSLQQKSVAEYEKALAAAKEQLQAAQQVNDPDKIRQVTDAVQDAETALNNARAAVKQTKADIANCNKELKTAQSEWTKAGKSMESFGKACDAAGKNLIKAGKLLSTTLTTPIVALGTAAVKVKFWKDGVEVPIEAVPDGTVDASTVASFDQDGTLHILITPEITGTKEAIDALSPVVDEVYQLGGTWKEALAGVRPTTTMDMVDSGLKRIQSYQETLDYNWWDKFWASLFGASTNLGGLDQSMKSDFNANRVAELSAYVAEMVSAIQQGEQVPKEDLENLQAIVEFLNGLDVTDTGAHIREGIAQGMTEAGFDSDAETVTSNLETALNTALQIESPSKRVKPTGEYVAAGVGEGMSGYDFSADAQDTASGIESALQTALTGESLKSAGNTAAQGLGSAMAAYPMADTGRTLATNVRSAVQSSLNRNTLRSAGVNVMTGLRAGILAGRAGVISAMRAAAREAVNAAKKELKIKSPSQVFRDEVGVMTMRGFGAGVLKESKEQARVIRNASRFLTGEAREGSIVTNSSDNRKTYNNNVSSTIQVQQMVVRDKQDIRSLAVEIATLTRRQQRGKGLRMA